jgi:hypothetical protein
MMQARSTRRFERVRLPEAARVTLLNEEGNLLGRVRMIAAGGLLLETEAQFVLDSPHKVTLVDEQLGIRRDLTLVCRYQNQEGAGFEFRALDVDAAVEIGIIIGSYYAAAHSAHV